MGVDPGPGLARLEAQILAQDPELGLVPPASAATAPSPEPVPEPA
ncbi:MAG: hypothetical protein M3340_08795 [Actinomycetota bacterium]|nr:hypothetical protein [Actinomycetota bacterium]